MFTLYYGQRTLPPSAMQIYGLTCLSLSHCYEVMWSVSEFSQPGSSIAVGFFSYYLGFPFYAFRQYGPKAPSIGMLENRVLSHGTVFLLIVLKPASFVSLKEC